MKFVLLISIIDGKMKIGFNGNDDLLPVEYEMGTKGCSTKGGCSLVGDMRGDENIALHSMHTLWVREHNRISGLLKPLNPLWKDDLLHRTARKINSAMWQHIVYNEYVPLLADLPAFMGYNNSVDPSISNSFSTAAFRYGHSLVPNEFPQLDKGFNAANDPITLQNAFFNRGIINVHGIEPTMFGLVANTSNNVDDGFAHSIARKLFVAVGSDDYLDLTALNIQRGRDHGLPGYNTYRRACGLAQATWDNINTIMVTGAATKFQSIYQSPDDIDIFAGGISERHMDKLEVGPTFNCILSKQFEALRDGDRYYYENPSVFTSAQLNSIKKVTMSTILCNNLKGIVSIQPNAFRTPEYQGSNTRKVCDSIPKLDLTPWKETLLSQNDQVDFRDNDLNGKQEQDKSSLEETANSQDATKGYVVSRENFASANEILKRNPDEAGINDYEENNNSFGSINVEKPFGNSNKDDDKHSNLSKRHTSESPEKSSRKQLEEQPKSKDPGFNNVDQRSINVGNEDEKNYNFDKTNHLKESSGRQENEEQKDNTMSEEMFNSKDAANSNRIASENDANRNEIDSYGFNNADKGFENDGKEDIRNHLKGSSGRQDNGEHKDNTMSEKMFNSKDSANGNEIAGENDANPNEMFEIRNLSKVDKSDRPARSQVHDKGIGNWIGNDGTVDERNYHLSKGHHPKFSDDPDESSIYSDGNKEKEGEAKSLQMEFEKDSI